MSAVQRLCSRSILIDTGKLIIDRDTQTVLEEYLYNQEIKEISSSSIRSLHRRDGFGELIRFSKCVIFDSQGNPSNRVLFGESFSIYLEAFARSDLKDLSIVIGIDTLAEYRITTVASEDSHVLFSASPSNPLRVIAHFNNLVLKSGTYLITLGIRSGTIGLDHLLRVFRLEVAEVSEKGFNPDSGTWGIIHILADWQLLDSKDNVIKFDKES